MSASFASEPILHVHEGATTEVASPIAPRQKFEKTFTVTQAAPGAKIAPAIRRLLVKTPGVTFVSFDAAATTPAVRISSELPQALEAFEVLVLADGALEIRLRNQIERQYILTELVLPTANMLLSLDVGGSGTVVLQDNVLVVNDPHADIYVKVGGSGDMVLTSHTAMTVRSFSLDISGSGDVQIIAPAIIAAECFTVQFASSGNLRLFTSSIAAPNVGLYVMGSGNVQIAALGVEASKKLNVSVSGSGNASMIGDQLTANSVDIAVNGSGDSKVVLMNSLMANTLKASVSGSGRAQVASHHGHCDVSAFTVTGSGSVDARDLVARHARTQVSGSGSAVFRASEIAETNVSGSGSATIVGEVPPRVTGNPKVKTDDEKPSKVERLGSKRRTPVPEPTKADAFNKLTGFNGTYNINGFSEFISGIRAIWNGTANTVIFNGGNMRTEP